MTFWLGKTLPVSYFKRTTSLGYVKDKGGEFEHCERIWQKISHGSFEKKVAWEMLKKRATDIKQCYSIWEKMYNSEKSQIWSFVKDKAETFVDCQWLWENTLSDSPEEAEIWELAKSKVVSFEDCRRLWENTPLILLKKKLPGQSLKEKAKSFLTFAGFGLTPLLTPQ